MQNNIILQIARLYKPHVGGVEKHVEALSAALIGKGYRSVLITEKFDENLPNFELIDGVEIHRVSYPKIKMLGVVILWLRILLLSRLIVRSKFIHVHDVYIWYLPFRVLFFWKKCFVTIHGWEGRYPISKTSLLQKKIATILSRETLLVGDYLKKLYGIKSENVLYGFIEKSRVSKRLAKKKLLVFLGRLEKDTGVELFLEYLIKSKDKRKFEVVFCGDGSFRSECEKFGKVTGFINPKKHLKDAEFLIASGYLSVFEGLKYKCKVLVIASSPTRRLIFKSTPFNKYVSICTNAREIAYSFSKVKFYVEKAYEWVNKYDVEYLYSKYAKMWGIN